MRWAGSETTILDCDKGATDPVIFHIRLLDPIEGAKLSALINEPASAALSAGERLGSPEVVARLKAAEVSAYAEYVERIEGPLPDGAKEVEGKANVTAVLLRMVAHDFYELTQKLSGAQSITAVEGKVSGLQP